MQFTPRSTKGLLGLSLCLLQGAAHAGIVFVSSNLVLARDQFVTIDFDQDGIDDTMLSVDGAGAVWFDGGRGAGSATRPQIVNFVRSATLYNPAVNFGSGVSIAGTPLIANTGTFRYSGPPGPIEYGQFADTRGYAGTVIKSYGPGMTAEETRYGWMDVEVSTTSANAALIVRGWAFESSSGTGIRTGDGIVGAPGGTIPEPASLVLAGLSLALMGGLAASRRRVGG